MIDLGSHVANTISDGDGESDLYLTFTFGWNFPDIQEGSKEAAEKKLMFRTGVDGSPSGGGSRTSVASFVFSGIDRKEGMLYLNGQNTRIQSSSEFRTRIRS